MRDAVSILDQAISINSNVAYDDLVDMLGITTNDSMINIVNSVISRDTEEAVKIVNKLISDGKDTSMLIKEMITHMRNLLMINVSNNLEDVLDMSLENIERLKEQSSRIRVEEIMRCINILQEADEEARGTKQGRIYLELAIIKMCKIKYDTSIETILSRLNKLEERIASGNIPASKVVNEVREIKPQLSARAENSRPSVKKPVVESYKLNEESKLTVDDVKRAFKDILSILKQRNNMVLSTALMMGKITGFDKGVISITFTKEYNFHKVRLERDDHRRIINDIFSEVLNEKVAVLYNIEDDNSQDDHIDKEREITNVFPEDIVQISDE